MARHHLYFLAFGVLWLIVSLPTIQRFWSFAIDGEGYSHSIVIPFLAGFLVYLERKRIFVQSRLSIAMNIALGVLLLCIPLALSLVPIGAKPDLSASVAVLILIWYVGFLACYGLQCFRDALLPLLLLLLMVPLPAAVLSRLIHILRVGSVEVTYVLLKLVGLPVFRHGFGLLVPGIDIEIADECSGIQSCLTLFITAAVAARYFLRASSLRLILCMAAFPIAIFKNAVRITAIVWLGLHVDSGFLHGNLHRYGGIPFSVMALVLLLALLYLLRRSEANPTNQVLSTSMFPALGGQH